MTKTYKYEDLFKTNENGEAELFLPPELSKDLDLNPGDNLKILLGDQGTVILEKINGEE
jgi:antitoxin component of MazEF toxin-antitoxin module